MPTTFKKTTPRVAATPCETDPKIMLAVSEKGGVSVYGLGRFPLTLYWSQWERLIEVIPDLQLFAEEHKAKLSMGDEQPKADEQSESERSFTINPQELALVSAEAERLTAAGDIPGAVKFNTIKAMVEARGKITFDQLGLVYQLKARK